MKTQKQEALASSFLSGLSQEDRPLFRELILFLSGLGYNPRKERSGLSFKHDRHNKQMAKMGTKSGKQSGPFFALRFSACRGYSQRFESIVRNYMEKYPTRAAGCVEGACGFCAGSPETHVYTHTLPGGQTKTHCGAYAIEIPNLSSGDVSEIKKCILEEHEYLLKHEA